MVVHSTDRKPFKCPYCILRYSYQSHMKHHIKTNHIIKENLNHFCFICKINFYKKSQLNKHNYIHTGEKDYKCYYPFCQKSYFNVGKLNLHIKKSHNLNHQSNNFNNKINNTFISLQANNKIDFYKTNFSKFNTFNSSNNISENISTCMDNNQLNISIRISANLNNLEEKDEIKEIANELNDNHSNLEDLNDMKYQNNLMNIFKKNYLNRNMQSISQNKKSKKKRKFSSEVFKEKKEKTFYKCPIGNCLKTYTSPYNLKVHIKTFHYKIKKFKCEDCGQLFNHKCSLNNHMIKTNHVNNQENLNIFEISGNQNFEVSDENIIFNEVKKYERKNSRDNIFDEINVKVDSVNFYQNKQNYYNNFHSEYIDQKNNELSKINFEYNNDENFRLFGQEEFKAFDDLNNSESIHLQENLLFKINPNFFENEY